MNLVRDVAEALPEQVSQGPAGAVADDGIGQVMEMKISLGMGLLDIFGIDLVEGEIGKDFAGNPGVEPREAHHALVAVLPDLPVRVVDIVLDQAFQVETGLLGLADPLVLFPVQDVGLGDFEVSLLHQDHFHDVLDLLDRRDRVSSELFIRHERGDVRSRLGGGGIRDSLRLHGLGDRSGDLLLIEVHDRPVPLLDP